MKRTKLVFQYKWYCKNCSEENVVPMDSNVIHAEYYRFVKCYCCSETYETELSYYTDKV